MVPATFLITYLARFSQQVANNPTKILSESKKLASGYHSSSMRRTRPNDQLSTDHLIASRLLKNLDPIFLLEIADYFLKTPIPSADDSWNSSGQGLLGKQLAIWLYMLLGWNGPSRREKQMRRSSNASHGLLNLLTMVNFLKNYVVLGARTIERQFST